MRLNLRFAAPALVLAAASPAAHAQANVYTLFRTNNYTQTNSGSATYTGSYLTGGIETTAAGDYGAGSLTSPLNVYSLSKGGAVYSYASPSFASTAALLAAYPHGTYGYSLAAGTRPATTGSIVDSVDRFSANMPVIPQYAALQSAVAGQPFSIGIAGFAIGTGTNDNNTFYALTDNTAGSTPISGSHDNTAFTLNIPSGLLVANHVYTLDVSYSSRLLTQGAGLGGAASFDAYDQRTAFSFTPSPAPEPASFAALGLGALALLRRRTKR